MKKKILVIHSLKNGTYNSFGKYIIEEGKKLGYLVFYPTFSLGESANYNAWKLLLNEYKLDEETIIIAHSVGASFIIKYLVEYNIKVKAVITIAGTFGPSNNKIINEAIERFKVDDKEINRFIDLSDYRYSIYSQNDLVSHIGMLEYFAYKIKSERVLIANGGHFGPKSGVEKIPKIFELIAKCS